MKSPAIAAYAVVAMTAIATFVLGVRHPEHNWDMIGYVAAAHFRDGLRGEALRATTYADVRNEVTPDDFELLTTSGVYRRQVYEDAAALEDQIPLYAIRPVYIDLIRGLGTFGVPYAKGTYVVASFFAALCVVIVGAICVTSNVPLFVVPLLVLATSGVELARLSTPDSLAACGSLLAITAWTARSRWTLILAAVLPALRTDFLILSVLLSVTMFYGGRRMLAAAAVATSLLVYSVVTYFQHGYGWLTLLNFVFLKKTAFPSRTVASHDLRAYLPAYRTAFLQLASSAHFTIYFVSGSLAAFFRRAVLANVPHSIELVAIPAAFVAIHLALYPSYEDRFFVVPASLLLVWTLASLRRLSDELRRQPAA